MDLGRVGLGLWFSQIGQVGCSWPWLRRAVVGVGQRVVGGADWVVVVTTTVVVWVIRVISTKGLVLLLEELLSDEVAILAITDLVVVVGPLKGIGNDKGGELFTTEHYSHTCKRLGTQSNEVYGKLVNCEGCGLSLLEQVIALLVLV